MKKILTTFLIVITSSFARVVVISDIDDTIKMSNSMGGASQIYHFFKMKSYPIMSSIYRDMQRYYGQDDISFFYVSAAPDFVYDQDIWLNKKGFPSGESFLRKSLGDETYKYKMRTIRKLLTDVKASDTIYFFGDNSSYDPQIYRDIIKEFDLLNVKVFIRDVSTLETFDLDKFFNNTLNTKYFFSERDLIGQGLPLSLSSVEQIEDSITNKTLVPLYTLSTLRKRMKAERLCLGRCEYAEEIFFDYY